MSVNKMTINIQMDNSAFDDDKWGETSRVLGQLAFDLGVDHLPVTLVDLNGNSCGTVVYEEE